MTFRAVVMAGGRGLRLGEAAGGLPKALLPLGQGHVLGRLLDQLVQGGCAAIDLCLGFQADEIVAAVGTDWGGVPVSHWREETPLGTAGALRQVAQTSAVTQSGAARDLVVVNCDIVAELDFADLIRRHRQHGRGASVVTSSLKQGLRFGTVDTAGDGCPITALCEKPETVHRIIAGIYLFRRDALQGQLSSGSGRLDMPDLLLRFLEPSGTGIVNLDLGGNWIDVGTPEDYDRARLRFG